jgi:hypothetical protein
VYNYHQVQACREGDNICLTAIHRYEDGENMKVAMLCPMVALPSETLKRNIGQVCLGKGKERHGDKRKVPQMT